MNQAWLLLTADGGSMSRLLLLCALSTASAESYDRSHRCPPRLLRIPVAGIGTMHRWIRLPIPTVSLPGNGPPEYWKQIQDRKFLNVRISVSMSPHACIHAPLIYMRALYTRACTHGAACRC